MFVTPHLLFHTCLKSLIISLHLVAIDRGGGECGGGECGGGCEDKSVCAWEDKILSAFMVKKSAWREYLAGVFGGSFWRLKDTIMALILNSNMLIWGVCKCKERKQQVATTTAAAVATTAGSSSTTAGSSSTTTAAVATSVTHHRSSSSHHRSSSSHRRHSSSHHSRPLIKELQELWKGVWTKDVATGTHFQVKATVLWTINDFPARSSLSGWSGQGYYACPTCNRGQLIHRWLQREHRRSSVWL
ncbi:hypothetical protein Tco_0526987 [Tanacetum coccineum]